VLKLSCNYCPKHITSIESIIVDYGLYRIDSSLLNAMYDACLGSLLCYRVGGRELKTSRVSAVRLDWLEWNVRGKVKYLVIMDCCLFHSVQYRLLTQDLKIVESSHLKLVGYSFASQLPCHCEVRWSNSWKTIIEGIMWR